MYKNINPLWIILLSYLSCGWIHKADAYLGIVWGRTATQKLVPSVVVDLLLQNGISELRIFQPTKEVLDAFPNTDIGVSVTLQQHNLKRMYKSQKVLQRLLNDNVKTYVDKGVKFRYVLVANEPFTKSLYAKEKFNDTLYYLNHTRNILDSFNLEHIKVTTPHFTDVVINVTKPSEADFRPDIKAEMIDILNFINKTGSPFIYDIFPIYSAHILGFDLEFAFLDNKSKVKVVDGENTYYNLFTFLYDALVVALTKAGFGDMDIVIGQIGWPTDGYMDASPKNAERFHRGLLKYLGKKEGTPLRPNKDINVYLLSLADENILNPDFGPYQRHWGIYEYDGEPKYNIDFTMRDRDHFKPATIKGTVKMPYRWCVFDNKTEHEWAKVNEDFNYACNARLASDCTSFEAGATCDNLSYTEKISYAYNMFYQMSNQRGCNMTGAILTTVDPSTPDCEFPIEILSADVDGASSQRVAIGTRRTKFNVGISLLLYFLSFMRLFCKVYHPR